MLENYLTYRILLPIFVVTILASCSDSSKGQSDLVKLEENQTPVESKINEEPLRIKNPLFDENGFLVETIMVFHGLGIGMIPKNCTQPCTGNGSFRQQEYNENMIFKVAQIVPGTMADLNELGRFKVIGIERPASGNKMITIKMQLENGELHIEAYDDATDKSLEVKNGTLNK
jgi:hypothetical protein